MQETSSAVRKFRLKPMVLARIFSEMAVLLVLIVLPVMLHCSGKFSIVPTPVKAVIFILSGISCCILPWFGYVTYQVNADQNGLTALALFVKHSGTWAQMKSLSRRSSYNFLRYVVELDEQKEITFPVLLYQCDELVTIIREHLPAGSGAGQRSPFRAFRTDPVALIVQFLQATGGIVFVVISWIFCFSIIKNAGSSDAATMVAFCAVCSIAMIWRTVVVVLMPRVIRLGETEIAVSTLFFEKKYKWEDVRTIKPSFPLLPEGFMLNVKRGSYLVGAGMDSADELQDTIRAKISTKKS